MPRPTSTQPTPQELRILKILWKQGPLPIRDIRQALATSKTDSPPAHTSVSTILNIMIRKKYLTRTQQANAHIYHPKLTQQKTTANILSSTIQRAFDGSAPSAMLALLDQNTLDADELKTIRKIINQKIKEQS